MLKILTKIMLILNPIAGFFIVASLITGQWYFVPLFILGVVLNFKLYFYAHKEECETYDKWYDEYSINHKYLGECYGIDYWENIQTGEIIEM